jgi:IS605 OrfB family transposase
MATFTYHTLLKDSAAAGQALAAYAKLFGEVERKLFVAIARGSAPGDLKSDFCSRFRITARQFNAIRVQVEAKIAAIKEQRKGLIEEMKGRIRKATQVVKKLFTRPKVKRGTPPETPAEQKIRLEKHHQKKRRLKALEGQLEQLKADHKAGVVHITFGSRKLFGEQFDLEANGYESHEQWLREWRAARSSQFFVLGSSDETAGCQGCVATVNEDESLDLRVRLPNAVLTDDSIEPVEGKYLVLKGVQFAHGHENVLKALQCSRQSCEGENPPPRHGVALSYRFIQGQKHGEPVWYVHVAVDVTAPPLVTRREAGAVGVDFNMDHLAVAETDRHGNLIDHERIDTHLSYRSAGQRAAMLGDAVKPLIARALASGKPIVVEKLNFSVRKAQLEDVDRRRARMLSALAYRQFDRLLKAACFRAGVEVLEVSPAYTSVIGAVNHAQIFGISIHQAAAFAIARRGLRMTETPRASVMREGACVPTRNGGHATFPLPVDGGKHGWALWTLVRRRLRAALAAHCRSGLHKRDPAPLSPIGWQRAPSGSSG